MLRIDILTGFPALFAGPLTESILKRAQDGGFADIRVHDLRDWTRDKHRSIDDSLYGGGAGMLLKPEPIFECVESLAAERAYDEVILTTPAGERFTQATATRISLMGAVIIICGHYKGVDQRVRDALVTREISIGDYVLTGGEPAAIVMTDAVVRLLPGVIGDGESLLSDSFMDGGLDCPHYTRPPLFRGRAVPDVLLSGDHRAIAAWREAASRALTEQRRPDLLGPDT